MLVREYIVIPLFPKHYILTKEGILRTQWTQYPFTQRGSRFQGVSLPRVPIKFYGHNGHAVDFIKSCLFSWDTVGIFE